MKIDKLNSGALSRGRYVSPLAEETGMDGQGVLCQSGSYIEAFNPLDDDTTNWK